MIAVSLFFADLTETATNDADQFGYADITEAIRDLLRPPKAEHSELFNRFFAYVALGNLDDHVRNLGFLSDRGSWELGAWDDVARGHDMADQEIA